MLNELILAHMISTTMTRLNTLRYELLSLLLGDFSDYFLLVIIKLAFEALNF